MIPMNEKLTPAMKQFHRFKQKHPDCILFFRMGDFYETFYEDAKTCSKVLGLTLTSRSKGTNPIPLAGVPYHAVEGYLKKMLQAGYRVAVCEQVEDPKTAKGVVKRDVVRIVTPGTLTDDILLNAKEDNFLCAVNLGMRNQAALSWVDISTGHFFVQELHEGKLIDELVRLAPAECLLADRRGELFEAETKKLTRNITQLTNAIVTERPGWYFDPYQARQRLLKHFGTATLEGFGISDKPQPSLSFALKQLRSYFNIQSEVKAPYRQVFQGNRGQKIDNTTNNTQDHKVEGNAHFKTVFEAIAARPMNANIRSTVQPAG